MAADLPGVHVAFAIYWSPVWAAGLGTFWLIGRIIYFLDTAQTQKGDPGFLYSIACAFRVLMLGALGDDNLPRDDVIHSATWMEDFMSGSRRKHWEEAGIKKGENEVSWFQ